MNIDDIKRKLQNHLTDGLVTIIGSGLSCAEGLPSMGELATHLRTELDAALKTSATWKTASVRLAAGENLEAVLSGIDERDEEAIRMIRVSTASYVRMRELDVIKEVMTGIKELRFGRLLPYLAPDQSEALPVITTNYDRLIEFAAELNGWGVDSMFLGQVIGKLDSNGVKYSFKKNFRDKPPRFEYRKRINLAKPHGSLDWFSYSSGPICTQLEVGPPLVVTPGTLKYRTGYDIPFDAHRERANKLVDQASRFLVIGYGFNDDHLEVHLREQIKKGKPCVIIAKELTDNARKILSESNSVYAITSGGTAGFNYITSEAEERFSGSDISDISNFVEEVLQA